MNAIRKFAYWLYSTIDQVHSWKCSAEKWDELVGLGSTATLAQLNDVLPYDIRKAVARIICEAEREADKS